jgi:hypothetical protein
MADQPTSREGYGYEARVGLSGEGCVRRQRPSRLTTWGGGRTWPNDRTGIVAIAVALTVDGHD